MNNHEGPIRVLLADDHPIFRESLKLLLENNGCTVVGEARSGEEAVALARTLHPQVVAMDLEMRGIGGLSATHRIRKAAPNARVVILSAHDDEDLVLEAMTEALASGYVLKGDSPQDMLTAIRAAASGKRYASPSVAPILLSRIANPRVALSREGRLTRREREVLRLIGQGATGKDIAQQLGISPKTAQAHRENLKQKLNVRTTAEMVRYAVKHKIVRVD